MHATDQLIGADLKQLSREVIEPTLYRNSDLVMAGRRYLYPVVVDWCRFVVFSIGGINVVVATQ